MARGVNKVILIGNLGFDPEVRYMPSGGAVANLRMATTEAWKDKQTGESTEHTEWHRVVLFNRLAEIAGEYLRKGSKIYIEGNIRTRKWQDKDGQDRYTTEIIGRELQMLDGKGASAAPMMSESEGFSKSPARSSSSAPQSSASDAPAFDELNDDIPF